MTTRSGKRTGGHGLLVDPFITDNGECTVETVQSLVAHYKAVRLGNHVVMRDFSGNSRADLTNSSAVVSSYLTGDHPYDKGKFSPKSSVGFQSATINEVTDGLVGPSNTSEFHFGTATEDSPFSVSFWTNCASGDGSADLLTYGLADNGPRAWGMHIYSNKLYFRLTDDYSETNRIGSYVNNTSYVGNATIGDWVHIVGTYDGSSSSDGLNIYIDGVLMTTSTDNNGSYTAMGTASALAELRAGSGANMSSLAGSIAEISIFSKELSQREVSALYEAKDG